MNLIPKKSLGQHFLNSQHVLEQIIEAANIQKDEIILEIGPGTGVLTEALLQTGAKVIAVEKDHRAFIMLEVKFTNEIINGQLKLIRGDILEENIFDSEINDGKYALIANIPYYITGSILQKFLENEPRPDRMVLLVQKEVAERIVARNDNQTNEMGKESILSISVKAFGEPKIIAKVSKGAFTPPPSIDSAILSIENISDRHFKENNVEISRFFKILKAGFAHKRKFAIRNIEDDVIPEKLKGIWNEIGLDTKIRSEDISLDNWFKISAKS